MNNQIVWRAVQQEELDSLKLKIEPMNLFASMAQNGCVYICKSNAVGHRRLFTKEEHQAAFALLKDEGYICPISELTIEKFGATRFHENARYFVGCGWFKKEGAA